ncbi:hypothetical protein SK128_005487, partial [Halocaridina rubra]
MSTWGDTLKAIFYGPGWYPGTPRLGDMDALPDEKAPRKKYSPKISQLETIYIIIHFIIIFFVQQNLTQELM